jgi:hypothetical protein
MLAAFRPVKQRPTTSRSSAAVAVFIKQACQKAGIELELKSIDPSVFFSSDEANPDTAAHFYADLQMFTAEGDPVHGGAILSRASS